MPTTSTRLRGLYLITPDEQDTARLLRRVESVLPFACMLQYRNKIADAAKKQVQAQALRGLCSEAGMPFVVNDDLALAMQVRADGVHLGEEDGALAQARQHMGGDVIIGASCYNDLARAQQAAASGASYIAFGAVFPSGTKPQARCAPLDLFAQAKPLGLPMVAIGGITPDNVRRVVAAGADMAAVIGAVFDAADPVAAARTISNAFRG